MQENKKAHNPRYRLTSGTLQLYTDFDQGSCMTERGTNGSDNVKIETTTCVPNSTSCYNPGHRSRLPRSRKIRTRMRVVQRSAAFGVSDSLGGLEVEASFERFDRTLIKKTRVCIELVGRVLL